MRKMKKGGKRKMSAKHKAPKLKATNKTLGQRLYEYRWVYLLGLPGLLVMLCWFLICLSVIC